MSHVIGTGGVAQSALGRNVGELRNQVRTFTNRLFQGSSVRTIIHETGHGMLSRAWADGSLTREETLQIIKTFNRAMGDRRMKKGDWGKRKDAQGNEILGEKATLMDEAAYEAGTDADKDRMLHEAVAEFLEGNMMRTRKQSADKSGMINGGTVNKNIKATTRLFLSYLPKTLRTKWESIMIAVRGVVGMSAMRGVLMKKAIRDGTLKEADIQAFLDKLTGRDLQAEHDGIVRDEQAAILGQEAETQVDEDNPFSIGRASFTPTDKTRVFQGAADSPTVIGPAYFSLSAYHGTPHKVDKFTTAKMGTGEGAHAYGWGLYFAQDEKVARNYRDVLAGNRNMTPNQFSNPWKNPRKTAFGTWIVATDTRGSTSFKTKREAFAFKAQKDEEYLALNDPKPKGNLYRVTLKVDDEDLLDWDKPLNQQSEKVKAAILAQMPAKSWEVMEGKTGQTYYQSYWQGGYASTGDIESASRSIAKLGIRGIRYLDGNSRADGQGSYNYVIFSDSDIEILEENGTPVNMGDAPFSLGRYGSGEALRDRVARAAVADPVVVSTDEWRGLSPKERRVKTMGNVDRVARENLPIINSDRNKEIKISREGMKHWNRFAADPRKAALVDRLREILTRSVFLRSEKPDARKAGSNIEAYHRLAIPVRIDSGEMVAFLSLQQDDKGSFIYDGRVLDIEMPADRSKTGTAAEDGKPATRKTDIQQAREEVILDHLEVNKSLTSDDAFSLAPSSYVDSMSVNVANRIKNPKARMAIFTRLLGKLGELKRDRDEFGVAFGKNFTRKAIEDPRKTASINREAAFREAVRRSELEDAAHAKHFGILDQPELAKLKSQPIHEYLAYPDSPLKGRLMSKSVAIARGSDFFDARGFGEYDGSESSSRTLYGGQLKPDQAAQELFDNGLISQPTPDAMWQALGKEASSVAKMKEYMNAAKADMTAARVTAKAEAKAWKDERMKEEKANYSPKARLLRVLIISVRIDYTLRRNSHELCGCAKWAYAKRFSATSL